MDKFTSHNSHLPKRLGFVLQRQFCGKSPAITGSSKTLSAILKPVNESS